MKGKAELAITFFKHDLIDSMKELKINFILVQLYKLLWDLNVELKEDNAANRTSALFFSLISSKHAF